MVGHSAFATETLPGSDKSVEDHLSMTVGDFSFSSTNKEYPYVSFNLSRAQVGPCIVS